MAKYIFILKRRDIEIEINSPDPDFISRQMALWQNVFISRSPVKSLAETSYYPDESEIVDFNAVSDTVQVDDVSNEKVFEETDQLVRELNEAYSETIDSDEVQDVSVSDAFELYQSEDTQEKEQEDFDLSEVFETEEVSVDDESEEPAESDELDSLFDDKVDLSDFEDEMESEISDTEPVAVVESVEDQSSEDLDEDLVIEGFEDLAEAGSQVETQNLDTNVDDLLGLFGEVQPESSVDDSITGVVEDESVDVAVDEADPEMDDSDFDALISAMEAEIDSDSPGVDDNISEEQDETDVEESLEGEFDLEEASEEPEIPEEVQDELVVSEDDLVEEDLFEKLAAEASEEPVKSAKATEPELPQKKESVPIEEYISSLTLKNPVDLLLATAYYIENYEQMDKFTTKDVSARTFKVFKRPVSPNIVLAAVNKGYIEVVPDFTGTAESNEYILTESGRSLVLNELS